MCQLSRNPKLSTEPEKPHPPPRHPIFKLQKYKDLQRSPPNAPRDSEKQNKTKHTSSNNSSKKPKNQSVLQKLANKAEIRGQISGFSITRSPLGPFPTKKCPLLTKYLEKRPNKTKKSKNKTPSPPPASTNSSRTPAYPQVTMANYTRAIYRVSTNFQDQILGEFQDFSEILYQFQEILGSLGEFLGDFRFFRFAGHPVFKRKSVPHNCPKTFSRPHTDRPSQPESLKIPETKKASLTPQKVSGPPNLHPHIRLNMPPPLSPQDNINPILSRCLF